MADLLLAPAGWLESGPTPVLLASPWTAIPTVTVACVTALYAGAGLGASWDRLVAAVRTAARSAVPAARSVVVSAALLVAIAPGPAPHISRAGRPAARAIPKTAPGGIRNA